MVPNWRIELGISLQVLLFELFFSFTIYFSVYYIFNIYIYPPTFGIGFWVSLILILVFFNYLIAKLILRRKKTSKKRTEIILFSSILISAISLFMFSTFIETISYSSIKINSVNDIKNSNKFEYKIKYFEILNEPRLYSRIKREKKPLRVYTEVFYTFPFKSESENIYYCLLYKEQIDPKLSNDEEQEKLNLFTESTKDSIKNHDFQYIQRFELLTKMYREKEGFEKTLLRKNDNTVFLLPSENSLKNKFSYNKQFFIKFMIGVFLVYVMIFFLTKIEEWK